jgi:trans-AT polyketide synthase/acyltransferase/oxidoreductase domain-containing protein
MGDVWSGHMESVTFDSPGGDLIHKGLRDSVYVIFDPDRNAIGYAVGGAAQAASANEIEYTLLASLPGVYPEWLGDRTFQEVHGVRFAYLGGSMARGISSVKLVVELAKAGALGMFGAAGLKPNDVKIAVDELSSQLDPLGLSWGSNLIHSPNEPALENEIVELYLKSGVRRVCASAFMKLTPAVVRYACSGLSLDASGRVQRQNYLFAKISREEIAQHFLSPPPGQNIASPGGRG